MSQPIDVAYVELHARGERDAARDINDAVQGIERDVERASKEINADLSNAFADAADAIEAHMNAIDKTLTITTNRQKKAWDGVADSIEDALSDAEDQITDTAKSFGGINAEIEKTKREIRRLAREFDDLGDRGILEQIGHLRKVQRELTNVRTLLQGAGDDVRGGLLQSLAQAGSTLRNISVLLPSPLVAALIAAVPAVIALGGALGQLLGLLLLIPGALAVLATIGGVLKVAFSGIGDAVKALKSGDVDKIKEAMKSLSPSARAFALELFKLQKPLGALKRAIQESLLKPLRGDLTRLANTLLPTFTRGLTGVGKALGKFMSDLLDLLGEQDIKNVFADLFASVDRIVSSLSPSIIKFIGTLFGVIEHSLPFVERMFDALGLGFDKLSDFLGGAMKTGDFERFLENAFAVMTDLGELMKSLGKLLGALFGDAGDEGRTFIQTLTMIVDKMTAFLNSDEGKDIIQRLLDSLPQMMALLEASLVLFGLLATSVEMSFQAIETFGGWIVIATKATGDFFQMLWGWLKIAAGAVVSFFVAIGGFFAMLGGKLAEVGVAIGTFFMSVVSFFASLPGKILTAIQAIPGLVVGVFKLLFDSTTYMVGFMIGTIVGLMIMLPGKIIGAIVSLSKLVGNVFLSVQATMGRLTLAAIALVVGFFVALPGRVYGAIVRISTLIGSVFLSVQATMGRLTLAAINAVINFFRQLPGKSTSALSGLGPAIARVFNGIVSGAFNIGRNIINGIVDGIKSGVGFAIDAAKRAANNILDGMKDALGIGSPSKVFADEVGKQIPAGVGVGVAEGATDLRSTIDGMINVATPEINSSVNVNAGGGGAVTFSPGAVQVIFSGVVPTAGEARQTGNLIGEQIAMTLAQRDVMIAVRTA